MTEFEVHHGGALAIATQETLGEVIAQLKAAHGPWTDASRV